MRNLLRRQSHQQIYGGDSKINKRESQRSINALFAVKVRICFESRSAAKIELRSEELTMNNSKFSAFARTVAKRVSQLPRKYMYLHVHHRKTCKPTRAVTTRTA